MSEYTMRFNSTAQPTTPQPPLNVERSEQILTADEWRAKAENLWKLLDDISTYFDMFKPNMEAFERKVLSKCEQRHKELESDGYELYPTL